MNKDFDPFNAENQYGDFERELAKLDPAWAKAALYFRSEGDWHYGHNHFTCNAGKANSRTPDAMRTRGLLAIWQELETRRVGFEAGDTIEILHAIQCCAQENLPLPTWLALAFNQQFTSTLKPGGTSLDDAFMSRDTPTTEAKREIQKRDWQIAGKLWIAAWDAAKRDESICSMDAALVKIASVMSDAGVGKTKARQLIEMIDKNQARLLPTYQPFSQFLAKRRTCG